MAIKDHAVKVRDDYGWPDAESEWTGGPPEKGDFNCPMCGVKVDHDFPCDNCIAYEQAMADDPAKYFSFL